MGNRMGFVLSRNQDSPNILLKSFWNSSSLVSVLCDSGDAVVDCFSIGRASSQLGPGVATRRSVWTRKENTISNLYLPLNNSIRIRNRNGSSAWTISNWQEASHLDTPRPSIPQTGRTQTTQQSPTFSLLHRPILIFRIPISNFLTNDISYPWASRGDNERINSWSTSRTNPEGHEIMKSY